MNLSVTKLFEFEACHFLPDYEGPCSRFHGHSYKLEVEVEGMVNERTGMIIDFSKLKQVVNSKIIDRFDHQNLNDFFSMPTAEIMVYDIYLTLGKEIKESSLEVVRVRLWETSTSYAEIKKC